MANRIRPINEKVNPVEIALGQISIEAAAQEAGVPPRTLSYDLKKVKESLPDVLANRRPGPKPRCRATEYAAEAPEAKRAVSCPECGSKTVKNGTYWVLNWVLMLTMGWLGVQKVLIQRRRCKACGKEVASPERIHQARARRAWWQQVDRLIAFARFKLRLSVRLTQMLVKFVYARAVSIGHIQRLTKRVGQQAETALARLVQCRQALARFLMFDETFPKMAQRVYSLGVTICEHGLIRSVCCIVRKGRDIPAQLRQTVGVHFRPIYFLTDLDVTYNKLMRAAGLNLIHLRDIVHLVRQIIRLFDEAVREVTLDVPKRLPLKERRKQRRLKRRLLRKRLQPMLTLILKAFSPGYESVCVLILEGVISQLADPSKIIQTASVQRLARRLRRFVKKHGHTINLLLRLSVEQGLPTTTNSLESKNSIFKPFSLIAKFFSRPRKCQAFFAGVALMENFDIKTRGPNKGTSAMQRAKIDLDDFGATDFFSAVGLPKPQISFAYVTE
jgi:predicted Zn-ribbon and HTH transcriptional regulator